MESFDSSILFRARPLASGENRATSKLNEVVVAVEIDFEGFRKLVVEPIVLSAVSSLPVGLSVGLTVELSSDQVT